MQNKITKVLQHMAHTHEQMARILDAERHVAVRMSQIVHDLPDEQPDFGDTSGLIESSGQVNKNIIAYLNALADLEEAMAEGVGRVIKELNGQEEE
ncbi:nucleoside-diphosphate sugar epimerase [Paenibacillus sp. BR2-3]|uniref:nucleoside-diphosphate sugar epimerase n=1 Tax=Paenibacillus sp. BR2-3 TaxID=3048494 RepID=UPI00397752E1